MEKIRVFVDNVFSGLPKTKEVIDMKRDILSNMEEDVYKRQKVFATILHYNIPVNLVEKYGGWKNRKTIDFYVKYATTLFERLGNRVDYWLPFNEFNAGRFNPYNLSLIHI